MAGNANYDALLSTTIENFRDTFADNISNSFFLMYWLTSQGRKITEDGGESILVPLMYGKNTTTKSYDGYEVLDTTPQEGLTAAKFPWKQVASSIAISRKEERQNSGKSRMINLLESKVQQAEISMRDELNRQLHGDGSGNGGKDLLGLDILVEAGGWGIVGGIDANIDTWWRNQEVNGAAASVLADFRTAYNLASRGNEHPDFAITTRLVFEAYEAQLVQIQRFVDTKTADSGFEMLKIKGCVIGWDEQCLADTCFVLNSRYLGFVVDSQTDLITTPFVRPENQDAKVAQILLMAQLVCSNRARQARISTALT